MLKQVAQKSQNTLENQGTKASAGTQGSDRALYDQFSDILDKIATSLNRVKQSSKDQGVSDLSVSLSQAASQQIVQKGQAQKIVREERPVEEKKVQAKTEAATVEKSDSKSETRAVEKGEQNKSDRVKAGETKRAETQEAATPAKNNGEKKAVSEKQVAQAPVEGQQQPDVAVCDSGVQVAVEVEADATKSAEVASATNTQVAVDGEEVSAESEESAAPVEGVEAPVSQPVEAVQVSKQAAQTKDVDVAQASVAQTEAEGENDGDVESVSATAATTPVEVETAGESAAARKTAAVAADVIDTKNAEIAKDLTNQEILAQSAHELLQQLILFSPLKAAIEPGTTQRLLSSVTGVQASSGAGNGQTIGTQFASQSKTLAQFVEKAPAKELPRPAALRTMERVESALKEVARSKDGKTISLRLDPPSLGSVKIDVTLKDGQLHARFVAESAQVSALLRDQSHELQQMLRKAGIEAEQITISVASEHFSEANTEFSSFNQQLSEQPERTYGAGPGVVAQNELSGESDAAVLTQRVTDHWIA